MTRKEIYSTLILEIQNHIGVISIMANYQAESAFNSENLQNSCEKKLGMNDRQYTDAVDSGTYGHFADDSCGYGLAQWTSSGRKASLFRYACDIGTSIGDAYMQVLFTVYEMKTSYPNVWRAVCNATDLRDCTRYVMMYYERPKDQSETAINYRYGLAVALDKELTNNDMEGGETFAQILPILSMGSNGKAVMLWQIIVGTKPDGIFGNDTKKRTLLFQFTYGLKQDGIVGRESWNAGLACLKTP